MIGKFIGNNTMGFKHGHTYNIKSKIQIIRKVSYPFCKDMMCICIYDVNSKAWCPYQSLEALFKNWEIKY